MSHVADRWHIKVNGRKQRTERYGSGLQWQAVWQESGGQRRKQSFRTQDAAKAFLAKIDVTQRAGTYVPVHLARTTIGEVFPHWWATKVALAPRTKVNLQSSWDARIKPRWEHTALGDITEHDATLWLAEMQAEPDPVKASYAAKQLVNLNGIIDRAVRMKLIPANPLTGVDKPRALKPHKRYLTIPQIRALVDAMPNQATEIWTLATTGIRIGEMIGLTVGDLNVKRARLTVHVGVSRTQAGEHLRHTKTGESRDVPVPQHTLRMLAEKAAGRFEDEPLLPGPDGERWRYSRWRTHWDNHASKSGVKGLTVHELRHTAASLAIHSGADVKVVQRMLGHATASQTLNVYAHLWDTNLDDVAVRMDALIVGTVAQLRAV